MESNTKSEKSILEIYLEFLKTSIDDKGIHPAPGIFKNKGSEGLNMVSFLVSPEETLMAVAKICREQDPEELIWGLDRFNGPNQDVDPKYQSVFTIYHLQPNGAWRTGVFGYNSQEDCYREVDWWNDFWKAIQLNELRKIKVI